MRNISIRRKIALLLIGLISFQFGFSQIFNPVTWSFSSKKINQTEAELLFTATIEEGWHVYSQDVPEGGPNPTTFTIEKGSGYELIGKVVEPKANESFDPNFNMNVKYFANQAVFSQRVKISTDNSVLISGFLEFMCCNDETCIPPSEVSFSFNLKGEKISSASTKIGTNNSTTVTSKVEMQQTVKHVTDSMKDIAIGTPEDVKPTTIKDSDVIQSETSGAKSENTASSLWLFFCLAFAGGLLAILTPCVFPMIPMTVSYFLKSGSRGKALALLYGISIVAIYVIFGVFIAVLFGADFGNWLSTHWIPNLFFFLIFVIFAASFFGYFEITMPRWLIDKSVKQEDQGGVMGTIFMAFTLVLVSFSCTGPIVGTVVVQAVGGQILKPVIGMLGFSLAFAIPFTLFAFFPQWLNKMPKSGGWLNSVKVVIGFIELAFALKFLNIPDQTYHWGILDREVYLGFWIVLFTMMGFYLLGKIKFPHDSEYPVIRSFPRLILIVFTFTFVLYLIPGLWGAPLKGISGWIPPMETQDFDVTAIVRENSGNSSAVMTANITETPKYADTGLKLPHGLKGYFDYDQALKASMALNKPVFVDFTGHGCTNCREMENRVWSNPEVLKRLRENYVVVALYVDDKVIEMPKDEWYKNKAGREVRLLGKKNTEIQIEKFGANAQPYYVVLDGKGNLQVTPRAYDLNIDDFVKFLDDGVKAFTNHEILHDKRK